MISRVGSAVSDPPTAAREFGLDWLRVFAFAVLILYHSGMAFVRWDWHIKNAEHSRTLELIMLFFNRWRLPLLFFISGAAVSFSLRRRTNGQFTRERFQRLLLPLAVGMFVIVPPQIYLERLHRGAEFASYAEFYRTVLDFVPYPQGSFSWHHLWFVAYIFVFSTAGLPVLAMLRTGGARRVIAWMAERFERRPWTIYLINIPSIAAALILGPRWPTTHNLVADWANLTGSFITFLWGFILASEPRMLELITRRRKEFLLVGIAATATYFGLREAGVTAAWPVVWRLVIGTLISALLGMGWILALVGYARVKITKGSPALRYANEAVYPFYIVHQTITVAIVFFVTAWPSDVWTKFAITAAGTFAGSWIVYEIVRRFTVLRPLFGLKPRPWRPRAPEDRFTAESA
jgi:hypothetical protein